MKVGAGEPQYTFDQLAGVPLVLPVVSSDGFTMRFGPCATTSNRGAAIGEAGSPVSGPDPSQPMDSSAHIAIAVVAKRFVAVMRTSIVDVILPLVAMVSTRHLMSNKVTYER